MKAKITYIKGLYDDQEHSVTVYGKSKIDLFEVAYALETTEPFIVTNLFITDDKVEEKVEN